MSSTEESRGMTFHYVSHALVKAGFTISENEGPIDRFRTELIGQLEQYASDPVTEDCLIFLREHPWNGAQDVTDFHQYYEGLGKNDNVKKTSIQ